MARSDTFTAGCSAVGGFSYARYFTLYVILTDRDGNPATNRSLVDFNVYCQSSGSGSINARHRLYFNINGVTSRDETVQVNAGSPYAYIQIASGTIEVDHNAGGTIPFTALIQAQSYGLSSSISGNFTLENIPRYTSITSFAVDNLPGEDGLTKMRYIWTASDPVDYAWYSLDGGGTYYGLASNNIITGLNPGTTYDFRLRVRRTDSQLTTDTGTIRKATINNASLTAPLANFSVNSNASLTCQVTNPSGADMKYYLELPVGTRRYSSEATKNTEYTFSDDELFDLLQYVTTSNTSPIKVGVATLIDGVEKYFSERTGTFNVVESNPTFSNFIYKDVDANIVNNLTGNDQTVIKGYSDVQGIVTVANKATAINGATMSKYRLSIGEKTQEVNYSDTETVSATIENADNNVITMYAIDSRGNSTAKQTTATNYIDYQPIAIKTMNVARVNRVQTNTVLSFTGSIWSGNFGIKTNSVINCYYRYRKTTDVSQTWSENINITPEKDGTDISFNAEIVGDLGATGFDIDESYEIQLFIKDELSDNYSNPSSFILGPGIPAMAIYKNNVAIGRRYDTELGGNLQLYGTIYKDGHLFDGDVYSTDEIPIGVWIDGKKIYRKVFVGNMPSITGEWENLFKLNADSDTIVNLYGNIKNTKTDLRVIPIPNYEDTSYYVALSYLGEADYVQVFVKGWTFNAYGMVYTIIVEYTKKDIEAENIDESESI